LAIGVKGLWEEPHACIRGSRLSQIWQYVIGAVYILSIKLSANSTELINICEVISPFTRATATGWARQSIDILI